FAAAAAISEKLNVIRVARPFRRVLSMPAPRYADLWTAAKAVYKTEPVIADGGEVIVYAPHLSEVSYTHGPLIDRVGYHVRDYFLGQWERFRDTPWAILAHSTHVKGAGGYEAGTERPRIRVTLATAIPEERCRRIDLGYLDPRTIDPEAWSERARKEDDVLVVHHAGEKLYRLAEG
ncbi:MAG TPA: hypothetical protein VNO21_13220, partial [Polyangiaceae bacterium]|nr:hypothetical protein [Polyangiaceae bacterium]